MTGEIDFSRAAAKGCQLVQSFGFSEEQMVAGLQSDFHRRIDEKANNAVEQLNAQLVLKPLIDSIITDYIHQALQVKATE